MIFFNLQRLLNTSRSIFRTAKCKQHFEYSTDSRLIVMWTWKMVRVLVSRTEIWLHLLRLVWFYHYSTDLVETNCLIHTTLQFGIHCLLQGDVKILLSFFHEKYAKKWKYHVSSKLSPLKRAHSGMRTGNVDHLRERTGSEITRDVAGYWRTDKTSLFFRKTTRHDRLARKLVYTTNEL